MKLTKCENNYISLSVTKKYLLDILELVDKNNYISLRNLIDDDDLDDLADYELNEYNENKLEDNIKLEVSKNDSNSDTNKPNTELSESDIDFIKDNISNFMRLISDKTFLRDFSLEEDLKKYIIDDEECLDDMKDLDITNDISEFSFYSLIRHIRAVYSLLEEKGKNNGENDDNKLRHWLKIKVSKSDNDSEDNKDSKEYNIILLKSSLKSFRKYMNNGTEDDNNNDSASAFEIQLCFLYMMIINGLYRCMRAYEVSIKDYVRICLFVLNPVIVGFTTTLEYDLEKWNAYSIIYELKQLISGKDNLLITTNNSGNSIEFTYRPYTGTFDDAINESNYNPHTGDNTGKKRACLCIDGEGTTLRMKIDIIGLNVMHDIFQWYIDKSIYSLITKPEILEELGKHVMRKMLSHTKQYSDMINLASKIAKQKIDEEKNGGPRLILTQAPFEAGFYEGVSDVREAERIYNEEYHNTIRNFIVYKNEFKDLKPEARLQLAKTLHDEFKLGQNTFLDIILAIELADKPREYVNKILAKTGSKQQAIIRKMIMFINNIKKQQKAKPVLHELYKELG